MIGKLGQGAGARGLLNYLAGERDHNGERRDRHELIGGTFAGRSPREIAAEFGALRSLRPTLGRHVSHLSLSLPAGDRRPSDDEWRAIADFWATGMGYEHYALYSHGDHVHVALSRLRANGSAVDDRHDWRRSERLIREIEERWSLQRVDASHLLEPERAATHRRAPGAAEIGMAERGTVPLVEQVRDIVEAAAAGRPTMATFLERVQAAGVHVRPNVSTGGRLNGFAYELDGHRLTSRAIGRGFSISNLLKRIDYVEDRDDAAIRAARDRSAARAVDGGPARPGQPGDQADDAGRIEQGSHRWPSGRNAAGRQIAGDVVGEISGSTRGDAGPGREEHGDGRGELAGDRESSPGHQGRDPGGARDRDGDRASERSGAPGMAFRMAARPGRGGSADAGGGLAGLAGGSAVAGEVEADDISDDDPAAAMKRLQKWARGMKKSLAAAAAVSHGTATHGWAGIDPEGRMPAMTKRIPPRVENLALLAQDATTPAARLSARNLAEQLQAFHAVGIDRFEWQPMPPKGSTLPKQRIRTGDAESMMKSVGWLRLMNSRGYDVFLRPAERSDGLAPPLVFVDDITEEQASKIAAAGYAWTALVESSVGNFHGWLNLGGEPRPRAEISAAAKIMAREFGGDPSSADWRHFGRAVGFTNKKPSRAVNGLAPFARLRIQSELASPAGEALLVRARADLAAEAAHRREQKKREAHEARASVFGGDQAMGDIVARFRAARARHRGPDQSDSAADFSACMAMMNHGFSDEQVAAALREARPDLADRHADPDDYIKRTITNARANAYGEDQQRRGLSLKPATLPIRRKEDEERGA